MGASIHDIALERVVSREEFQGALSDLETTSIRVRPDSPDAYCLIGETACYTSPEQVINEICGSTLIDEIAIRKDQFARETKNKWRKLFGRWVRQHQEDRERFERELAGLFEDPTAYMELKLEGINEEGIRSKFGIYQGEQQGSPVLFCGYVALKHENEGVINVGSCRQTWRNYRAVIRPERFRP